MLFLIKHLIIHLLFNTKSNTCLSLESSWLLQSSNILISPLFWTLYLFYSSNFLWTILVLQHLLRPKSCSRSVMEESHVVICYYPIQYVSYETRWVVKIKNFVLNVMCITSANPQLSLKALVCCFPWILIEKSSLFALAAFKVKLLQVQCLWQSI